jgi:Tol biopolymer transport system component/DNA-binding winged helix-turn-helix (wHTH) protein
MPVREKHVGFGPFQLDTQCGQLRKDGIRLKLQGQPVEILQILLETPGTLVTRDEFRQRLWSSNTFVDFDHSLNAAVQRLRQALSDEADTPRYIETIPKRGYRFIGEVFHEKPQPDPGTAPAVLEPLEHKSGNVPDAGGVPIATQALSSDVNVPDTRALPSLPEQVTPRKSQARRFRSLSYVLACCGAVAIVCTLWILSRTKEELRPPKILQFTSLPGFETRPSFSPDGTQIVFAAMRESEGIDIYVKAVGDEKIVRLTEPPGVSRRPQWSPDGRAIAYAHFSETGVQAIFLMTPLGGAKHKIRELSNASSGLTSWSPDSKLLAYDDKPKGESSGIFVMPATGSPAQRLTTAPAGMFDSSPAFSPDRQDIAFLRASDEAGSAEIRIVSITNHNDKKVATLDGLANTPAWTADAKEIILAVNGHFVGNALYSVPASGGEPKRLTIISSDASWPAISADGHKLAYVTTFFDSNIWKLSLKDSSPPTKLIASSRMEMQPSYSPDGQRLAYVSERDGTLAIWSSNTDGTDQVRLASVAAGGGTPVWSPDGKHIAVDSNEGGHWNILLMEPDGSNPVRLTDDSSEHRGPAWSADGDWVYFSSNRSGTWEMWKISVRSRQSLPVTSHGGSYGQESPDGKFVYYMKLKVASMYGGFPMPAKIWRIPAGGGAEELVWQGHDLELGLPDTWHWHVLERGIYLVDNAAKPKPALKFLDLNTRTIHTVRELDKQVWGGPGLAISPDERTALIAHADAFGSDIMIVENFR